MSGKSKMVIGQLTRPEAAMVLQALHEKIAFEGVTGGPAVWVVQRLERALEAADGVDPCSMDSDALREVTKNG